MDDGPPKTCFRKTGGPEGKERGGTKVKSEKGIYGGMGV